ncbi:MAG: DNA replication complex GINS protein SLD5, variant 2 [Marteilia pararefringens]
MSIIIFSKINEYPYHFLLKDSEMFEAKQNLLTSVEYRFARSLAAAEEKYFTSSFLSNLPKQLSTFKKKALQIDESKAYVFIKVNTPQPDFVYEYNNDIIELPLKKGDKLMVKCKLIEDLLENNEVSLL